MIDTYVYFVSYYYQTETESGYGNMEIISTLPLANVNEVRQIDDIIKDDKIEKNIVKSKNDVVIIVLNFQLLDSYNKNEKENN